PKDHSNQGRTHELSVKLNKRQFAVHNHEVRHIEIGSAAIFQGPEILESSVTEETSIPLTKKEKHQSKKEAFLQRLKSPMPYSKSHNRRLRRKAKEQIIGGDLNDLQAAIAALDDNEDALDNISASVNSGIPSSSKSTSNPRPKPGKIGEGTKNPLSQSRRKHALVVEQLRQPLILFNPEFSSNPFQTLRTHAQNTHSRHMSM
ncbi:hypothetical protein L208DRAFT_1308053, partial [Tricholoma matsutake]